MLSDYLFLFIGELLKYSNKILLQSAVQISEIKRNKYAKSCAIEILFECNYGWKTNTMEAIIYMSCQKHCTHFELDQVLIPGTVTLKLDNW